MSDLQPLAALEPGMRLLVGGGRVLTVSRELAAAFAPGDGLAAVDGSAAILHLPAREREVAAAAVSRAVASLPGLRAATDAQLSAFFGHFAARLGDDNLFAQVSQANAADVERARARGRSTTRLLATETMRASMIEGLLGWTHATSVRGRVLETVDHGTWQAELVGAELGVVAFVFEGRPNVVADATGVLRSGNAVVFRIGSDALQTAKKIIELCTAPALRAAGLPGGAVTLLDSTAHAAGWALFQDRRLSLAVARGSGAAVDTLGGLAQSAGVPVSLHGTGGAWLVLGETAQPSKVTQTVYDSLDRKVCNTLNTCCMLRSQAEAFMPAFLAGLKRAGERRGTTFKLHVTEGSQEGVPADLFETSVAVGRAEGLVNEQQAVLAPASGLGREWEWENTPEVTLVLVESVDEAMALFNRYSPQFVASLLSEDADEHARFYAGVNAPFVGDGFTRWVDGQYALCRPELGLSNWQQGRLFGRGGILTGDSVFTVRTRVRGTSAGKPT